MNYRSLFIATAQATAFYLSGFVIPVIGQILILFTPVPLIALSLREGRPAGLLALAVSTGIVSLLAEWQIAAFLIACFGMMAIGVSEGMRKQLRVEYIALAGGLLPLIVMGTAFAFYVINAGKNPVIMIEEYIRQSVTEAAGIYTKLGLTEMAAAVNSLSQGFVYYFVRLLPGILVATFVTQAAVCYGVARGALMRNSGKTELAPQTSLALWHAPDMWVWGLIGALALLVVVAHTPSQLAGWNVAIVFATVYLVQGIALIDYFLRKMNMSVGIRVIIISLLLAMPPLIAGTAALGVADIWADFRKVRQPPQ